MSESIARTGIYTILNAVTDVGKVYDYERWAKDWGTFINLFKTTISGKAQIRGWEIKRKAAKEDATNAKTHIYGINGYMGVDDSAASEKTFNAVIEAIATAFRADKTLNKAVLGHDFIQVELIEPRMFASVLCHCAELSLVVYDHQSGE